MLLYSTLLNIENTLTPEVFIKLVIENNKRNPHSVNVIPGLQWDGTFNFSCENDTLSLTSEYLDEKETLAVRYRKEEPGVSWTTDYVINFPEKKISIRLERNYNEGGEKSDGSYHAPSIVKYLVEQGFLSNDHNLPIKAKPHKITVDTLDLLKNVVLQKSDYDLPVIYVSKTRNENYLVNTDALASSLRGAAHILTLDSYDLDGLCKKACEGKDEYDGNIGIYYPKDVNRHITLSPSSQISETALRQKIINEISVFNASRKIETAYTWTGVHIEKTKEHFQQQLNQEKEKANIFIETFDKELDEYKEKEDRMNREITKLRFENDYYKEKEQQSQNSPILVMGNEKELYQGEIKDMLLFVMSQALKDLEKTDKSHKSRRADILRSVIEANNYEHLTEKKRETIKSLMKNYSGMTDAVKRELNDLGFQCENSKTHLKLTYYDSSYTCVLAKTPSDWRAGKNDAADIINTVF